MSDLNPRDLNPGGYDRYGNAKFDPPEADGKGPYVLLAILTLIGLVGGLLYFNGTPMDNNVAQAPERTTTAPMRPGPAMTAPAPAIPAQPAAPATPNTGMTTDKPAQQ